MNSEQIKTILIYVMLGLLTASAFFMRLESYNNSSYRSTDEIVYYVMAKQVQKDGLAGYNTIPYGKELKKMGRPTPDYFNHPLFKYPPLFCYLLLISFKLFGTSLLSAAYVSILFGVLLIPITYWIGKILFNRVVGLLSVGLVFIDPVTIITSQKVWMDTPLAFFTVLNVLFLIMAIKRKNGFYFILGGIACGLAVLIKYPGILGIMIYAIYAILFNRRLFVNRAFLISLSIPFIMLLPWFYLNYEVYGLEFIKFQIGLHSNKMHQKETLLKIICIIVAVLGGFLIARVNKLKFKELLFFWRDYDKQQLTRLKVVSGISLVIVLSKYIINSVQYNVMPFVSWSPGQYANETIVFYFGRLLEYSMIYILSYFMLFFVGTDQKNEQRALKVAVLVVLGFYSFWGNFQSRYILGAIPLLVVLAAAHITYIWDRILSLGNKNLRNIYVALFILFLGYSLTKTFLVNQLISFPNDLCFY